MQKKTRENKKVQEFILMGDANENIENNKITKFINLNGLVNVHEQVNNITRNGLDHACKHGKNCIDAPMRTHGLLDCIAGCQLTECDQAIMNNHRRFLVDAEIKRYCNCRLN